MGSWEPSFAELRPTYAHDQYINNLGKLKSDDPKRQSRLALANLRENLAARRDLAALHAARSHLYGERDFGPKPGTTTNPDRPPVENPNATPPISDGAQNQP